MNDCLLRGRIDWKGQGPIIYFQHGLDCRRMTGRWCICDGVTYSRTWPRKGREAERRSMSRGSVELRAKFVRGCEVGGGKRIS
jgi:hypothetical protein